MSALEALASGVPVIATNAGGLPEVVRHGATGVLCRVGDVEGMATAAVRVLRDGDEWQRMSAEGARDARDRFAVEPIVIRYEELYRSALANGRPA